ncbi:26S proteasome regulatory subunit 10B homolog A isoform X1 [Selaginella moellendorffii]|uniref:26S proteasome regulatory subunit 10B homolog A isoform X1 n=1 Tax=Selaginella moellendorffii TaxID=88036 RepID=UPI000D1CD484|nr:26S proteasome regulatory subunit 10B homolog A isoform X1 [Selaginella moellendorffii]|eukprot:XP_024542367.1 26S proteasome regulatory subunit 10B homolog A isoform X1 [Selaginella moellendorffii]
MMLVRGIRSGRAASALRATLVGCSQIGHGARGFAGGSEAADSSPGGSWGTLSVGILFGAAALYSQPAFSDSKVSGGFFSSKVSGGNSTSSDDMEKTLEEVREGLRERLRPLKMHALPPITVVSRGQQVAVRFPVPPTCDTYRLVVDLVSHLGGDVDLAVRASSSAVARQLVVSHPDRNSDKVSTDRLCVVIFEPLIGEKSSLQEIEFLRKGKLSSAELDTVISTVRTAAGINVEPAPKVRIFKGEVNGRKVKRALDALDKLGVKVYGLDMESGETEAEGLTWQSIAGYHEQKREIEDNVLLALKRPEVYDSIARGTKEKFESNRPRAILFEGPPGCGKTSCARVIASQAGVPLLYVPLEVVTSKYYGESERLLSSVFNAGNDFPDGAIVFLDEIDSLATSRDSDMHEATRRMLSVLLRQMDGFEQDKRIVVIAATNRKQDLDPALLSRFDASITFDLPDLQTREEIVAQYARHLSRKELSSVAATSEGMSGRDLRDVCQQAERKWASKLIKGLVGNPPTHELPPVQEYMESAAKRRRTLVKWAEEQVVQQSAKAKVALSTS